MLKIKLEKELNNTEDQVALNMEQKAKHERILEELEREKAELKAILEKYVK